MKKLLVLLLMVLPLASMVGCGTDRVVTPIYTGPPQSFGFSAVLSQAVSPGLRVFLKGNIVSMAKPDSMVLFGTVGPDGRTISGSFSKSVTPNDTGFFLIPGIEQPDLTVKWELVPLKVSGVELTAIKANEFGLWWELGLTWSADGPAINTLRDDRSRIIEVPVDYYGDPSKGEMVSGSVPVRCKSSWSGIGMAPERTSIWGTYVALPSPHYHWTVKALKPMPGADLLTQYFRFEDLQVQRFYGCFIGGLEVKNLKYLGVSWSVFEVRLDTNGIFTNPREHDDRGGSIYVTPGK